jgi:hypothetical protein
VAEGVEADQLQARLLACGLQHAAKDVLRRQRRATNPHARSGQEPEEQPPALREQREQSCQLLAAHRTHLFLLGGRAMRQVHVTCGVGTQQALPHGSRQARAQRRHDVAHRLVAEGPPLLAGRVAQPRHELGHSTWRDLGEPHSGREELQRVPLQYPPVFLAGALAEPAPPAALVAVHPLSGVLVQRHPGALIELAALDIRRPRGLRPARLIERPERLVPLLAVRAVGDHVAGASLVDAWRLRLLGLGRHHRLPSIDQPQSLRPRPGGPPFDVGVKIIAVQ